MITKAMRKRLLEVRDYVVRRHSCVGPYVSTAPCNGTWFWTMATKLEDNGLIEWVDAYGKDTARLTLKGARVLEQP